MIRYHEATDASKVAELAVSIEVDGWQGAPLVAIGDELLTGAHRHTAYEQVFGTDNGIPVVDLADVFAEDGLDYEAVWAKEMTYGYGDTATIIAVLDHLSDDIRDAYGIDVQ